MAIVVFDIPIPVVVDENGVKKEGYAIYAESGGMLEVENYFICMINNVLCKVKSTLVQK